MDDKFVLGSLLLEKYITVFNNEEKTLNILKKKEENIEVENVDNNFNTKIALIVILVFLLSAVIFIFVGKLYGKKIFSSRKKKANELIDDDYDYTPNIKNNVISFEWNNLSYNFLIFFLNNKILSVVYKIYYFL